MKILRRILNNYWNNYTWFQTTTLQKYQVCGGPCEFTIEMPVHAVTYTCPILPEIASRLLDDDPMELESRDLDGNMVDKKRGN